jgi:hypothetical protein
MSLPSGRREIRSIISGKHRFPYRAATTAAFNANIFAGLVF